MAILRVRPFEIARLDANVFRHKNLCSILVLFLFVFPLSTYLRFKSRQGHLAETNSF